MLLAVCFALCACAVQADGTALTLPIEEGARQQIIDAFNTYRASLGSSNMESLTEWSTDLEEEAQNLGSTCQLPVSHGKYGVAAMMSNTLITPDVLGDQFKQLALYYGPAKCVTAGYIDNCKYYKQVVWYRGGKIGCASTLCSGTTTSFTFICAFEQKANLDQEPFAVGTAGAFCASSEVTNCPNCLCVPLNGNAPTVSASCGGSVPSNLIPLYRLVHKTTAATFLSTEQSPSIAAAFVYQGIFGYVSASADSACDRLVPLVQMSARSYVDYVHVAGEEDIVLYDQKNYNFVKLLGYVVSREGLCGANATAHQFTKSTYYNYYTTDKAEAQLILQKSAPYAAYSFVKKPFAFWA